MSILTTVTTSVSQESYDKIVAFCKDSGMKKDIVEKDTMLIPLAAYDGDVDVQIGQRDTKYLGDDITLGVSKFIDMFPQDVKRYNLVCLIHSPPILDMVQSLCNLPTENILGPDHRGESDVPLLFIICNDYKGTISNEHIRKLETKLRKYLDGKISFEAPKLSTVIDDEFYYGTINGLSSAQFNQMNSI
jgi:hypothetical protein